VEDHGFADEPSVTRADDGSLYVAWLSLRDGVDTLLVARYAREGDGFTRQGVWEAESISGVLLLGPRVVSAGNSVFVVYAAERDGNWDVLAVECDARGLGSPVQISSHAASDISPDAVYHEGTLYVVWETNRGGERHIMFNMLLGGRAQLAEQVSAAGASNYSPAIVTNRTGHIAIAWHSWREDNYDIYYRQRQQSGRWGFERRVTYAPAIDRNAALASYEDDVWIVYEHATNEGYATGRTTGRRLVVAKVTANGVQVPQTTSPGGLAEGAQRPAATFDETGRLWLAFLGPSGGEQSQWFVHLTGFTGTHWLAPLKVAQGKGLDRRPSLIVHDGEVILAFQNDDFPEAGTGMDLSLALRARNQIVLGAVGLADVFPSPPFIPLEPLQESGAAFEAASRRTALGENLPTPTIDYQDERLHLYYGDLHAHTTISGGDRRSEESVSEAYQSRRDINRLDFVAITDHGYNLTPLLWAYSAKMVRANEDPGRFLPFLAQEWTSSFESDGDTHPYGFFGHRNLIFADSSLPRWWNAFSGQTPAELWGELRGMGAAFIEIPHQLADTEGVSVDWSFADEQAQPVAEIFQQRGSYEAYDAPRRAQGSAEEPGYFLQDAWQRGIVIGVIASPGYGGGAGKAGVWAPQLTRTAVLDAIRARRTFGTTGARMMLDVRVNGHLMGEKIAASSGRVEIRIRLSCPGEIARIEILRNNEIIHAVEPGGRSAELTYVDRQPLPGTSYYYVRVTQTDDEMAGADICFLLVQIGRISWVFDNVR